MKNYRRLTKLSSLLLALFLFGFLSGCATSSQLADLQVKVDEALQEAQHATELAKNTESKCNDFKIDAEEEYKAVQQASDRAEKAALRAAGSEESAMDAAKSAKASAEDAQVLYDRITSK